MNLEEKAEKRIAKNRKWAKSKKGVRAMEKITGYNISIEAAEFFTAKNIIKKMSPQNLAHLLSVALPKEDVGEALRILLLYNQDE